jgi:hypothetical protein
MSDFKKKATPPAPVDDYSPAPQLGTPFSVAPETPAVDQDQDDANVEINKRAAPYWHPAWERVQEVFEEFIAVHGTNSAELHAELPADEFKIRMIVDARASALVETLMEDVKSAVEQSEQQPKRKQQPTKGA